MIEEERQERAQQVRLHRHALVHIQEARTTTGGWVATQELQRAYECIAQIRSPERRERLRKQADRVADNLLTGLTTGIDVRR